MKNKNRRIKFLPLVIILTLAVGIGVVYAYLSDAEQMTNRFTVGMVKTTINENFPPPEDPGPGTNDYVKEISVTNEAYSPAYVRVAVEFSNGDVKNGSYFSADGTNYYTIDDFKNHLPTGWEYISDPKLGGSYYYYTRKVGPGESTPQLIKKVRTIFENEADVVPYDIFVYAEGVQTLDVTGDPHKNATKPYLEVWKSFLNYDE